MCERTGPIARWCHNHQARYYTYEHVGPRPVITSIRVVYKDQRIVVHATLKVSGGKASKRPPWNTVFCLTGKYHLGGSGVNVLVNDIVTKEVKRLGWGWSRGVRCQS